MRMKLVKILHGGEILAEPVLTEKNSILLPKGTTLKKDYVPLIQSLGVETLMIEDPYEDFEKPHPIISHIRLTYYLDKIRRILENHIYKEKSNLYSLKAIAHEIVDEMNQMPEDMVIDMKERTSNLYEHTLMVTLFSILVAKKMKIKDDILYQMAIGCLLHDLGIRYITVSYENCDWTERSHSDVFEFKKHTIFGYTALEEENWIPTTAKTMILSHHENIEGTGFPLKQKQHSIECKIIQACDMFDCCISGMECKRISVQEALNKIRKEAGIKLEEKVVDKIVSIVAKYPVGTTVKTSAHEDGVVVSQTNDPEHPIIMVLNTDYGEKTKEKHHNLQLEKNISILHVV